MNSNMSKTSCWSPPHRPPHFWAVACVVSDFSPQVVFVLAMDVFGPITDNAGGIVEAASVVRARVCAECIDHLK